jgi:hypothetical protein
MVKYHVQILCIVHIEEQFNNHSTYFIILPVALLKMIYFISLSPKYTIQKLKVLDKIQPLFFKNSGIDRASWK